MTTEAVLTGYATMRLKNVALQGSDGPFGYVYTSISAVPGIRLPADDSGKRIVESFEELGAVAVLTNDSDPYAFHIDRSSAIGVLLLTGLVGPSRFKILSKYWRRFTNLLFGEYWTFARAVDREAARSRKSRVRHYGGPGCFLVYKAEGELYEPAVLKAARRIGDIGFGFDVIDSEVYRALHRRAVHSTAAALSLGLSEVTGSPETRFLSDAIYLTGPGGLIVYPKTITAGAVGLVVTSQNPNQAVAAAKAIVPLLMTDEKLGSAVTLYIQSQTKSHDNLRAFIPAWSALELLINRLFRLYQTDWGDLIETRVPRPAWDRILVGIPYSEYRMRDRFFAVACVLEIDSAESDAKDFNEINSKRSDYYHGMEVKEQDLPTHGSQNLFRKYLKLALAKATASAD